VIWGQWHVKQVSGALDLAIPLAEECLSLSRQLRDDGCELQAHHAGWSTQFFRGEFGSCLEHADRGWSLYDLERHADHRFGYGGHDPGVCGRYFGGICHWFLGRPDQSAAYAAQSMEVARSIDHPFSSVVTQLYTAYLAYFRREHRKTRTLAQEGLDICEELGFPTWLPGLAQLRDWALVVEEADTDALARMSERISIERVPGQLLPGNVAFFIDACVRLRERVQGLAAVSTGLKLAETLGQRWIIAELHRLHAALFMLDSMDDPNEVEAKLRLSLEIAHQQHAKSIELRSATTLAQFRLQAGDKEEAHRLLMPLYSAFNEGFDTADLKDAKALLEELA
jgi:predicted ATPase